MARTNVTVNYWCALQVRMAAHDRRYRMRMRKGAANEVRRQEAYGCHAQARQGPTSNLSSLTSERLLSEKYGVDCPLLLDGLAGRAPAEVPVLGREGDCKLPCRSGVGAAIMAEGIKRRGGGSQRIRCEPWSFLSP